MAATAYAQSQRSSPGPLAERIATRQHVFFVPFRVEQTQRRPLGPTEVQLHVSEDRGVTWKLHSKVPPQQGRFAFRAVRDGEYWFMVRTLDSAGRLEPAGPARPELRVLVDTQQPVLELRAVRGEAGVIHAEWQVSDAHLRPDSLKITYQVVGSDPAWHEVAVDPLRPAPDGLYSGRATWWPHGATGPMVVRAEVADTAGNRASTQAQVNGIVGPVAGDPSNLQRAGAAPTPRRWNPPAATAWPGKPTTTSPLVPESARPESLISKPSTPAPLETAAPPSMPSHFPPVQGSAQPHRGRLAPGGPRAASTAGQRDGASGTSVPGTASPDRPTSPPARTASMRREPAALVDPHGTHPSVEGGLTAGGVNPGQPGPAAPRDVFREDPLPPGIQPRMVNSRRFELEYEVESIGPSGIGRVELWVTRDGGRTWSRFGVDDDSRSPYRIAVEGEGVYGFRIVIETSAGLRGTPPRSGELPEVWVGVDMTKPAARLVAVEQGTGNQSGELVIRWEATDQLLATRPISLSFGQTPVGPWSTIASGLPNSSPYHWRLDNRVPDQIYLRLEVRDEAGNVQMCGTPEPVKLDRVRPQGRILSVRPLGDAARRPRPTQVMR